MSGKPETTLPPKPRHGSPCNGCGVCCATQLCPAATMGGLTELPCEALRWKDGRTWCGLVLMERSAGMKPLISKALGIGTGCSMED